MSRQHRWMTLTKLKGPSFFYYFQADVFLKAMDTIQRQNTLRLKLCLGLMPWSLKFSELRVCKGVKSLR